MPTQRMDLSTVAPDAIKAIYGMEKYSAANVDPTLYELVKLRASMINGCAFCVDMHSHDATEAGEKPQRLYGLAAWEDSPFYTDRERAALALTDEVTRVSEGGVSDETWNAVADEFSEREVADLLMAIATINVWNRIAIPTLQQPPIR
ncbi:carboxymuconolactone decarboxylase family protein [Flexivirga meconopsidis]|uniref:carboxymuconolactone decarboxylase family protein n=1 Tax=Flexivirga meconopsidis TaxID=2977121 RepID=UPI00223FF2C0|nr:carboxymuconolactone decarboxylase family protein [Flexivirga meconopsidis]